MGTVKHILLTGSSGYLGRNLVKSLNAKGYELTLLARPSSKLDYLNGLNGAFNIYQTDDLNFDSIFEEREIDAIIHTAASYGRKGENVGAVLEANLIMPVRLLDAAIRNGVKYFINTDTALPRDLNDYSRTKKHFLDWLISRCKQINVANLELEYFFGPNDDSTKFITYVINELVSGKTSIDFTEATQIRDFIYIDDVVNAYEIVIENLSKLENFTTIEVGSGTGLKLRDIITEVQNVTGRSEVKLNFGALPMRSNEIMESVANHSFLTDLGWSPKHTFIEGLYKTIESDNKTL